VSPTQLGVPSERAVPYELDLPSVFVVSQQTLEVVDHGVAPEGDSRREAYPK
jgi:hypothetical protein